MKQQRWGTQQGFTLVELLIVVLVLGLVSLLLAPSYSSLMSAQKSAYIEKHRLNNMLIGNSLISYAANSTQYGRLPAAFTGSGYTKTVYNPATTALAQVLTQSGVNPAEINDDGTAAKNVRVYQVVQGFTQNIPLYFQSGPQVTLTYDFGAIYMTACPKANTTCNPMAATGVPGSSPALTAANYSTWAPAGTDGQAYFVSSLPVQKQMLATTVQRLDKVRDSLLSYFRGQQITAAGGDVTNWYPNQVGTAAAGSLSGASPATNQGCRDGWYDISNLTVAVLPTVGLAHEEHGVTAWGGAVQYCRDYDPTGLSGANTVPHYAALRIRKNASVGGAPDGAVPGNNIVLTF